MRTFDIDAIVWDPMSIGVGEPTSQIQAIAVDVPGVTRP